MRRINFRTGFIARAVALGIGLGACSAATADARFAASIVTDQGWTLTPAIQGKTVVGFLAHRGAAEVGPSAFSVVWLERQPSGTYTWEGVRTSDPSDAARMVHLRFAGQVELADASMERRAAEAVGKPLPEFVPMSHGLAVTDRFQAIAANLDGKQIEWVVAIGGEGAPNLSGLAARTEETCVDVIDVIDVADDVVADDDSAGDLPVQPLLAGAAERVEKTLRDPNRDPRDEVPVDGSTPQAVSLFGCCIPWTFTWSWTTPGGCGVGTPNGVGGCVYSCSACVTRSYSQRRNFNCSWGPIVLTGTSAPGPCTDTKPQTAPGVCP